MKTRSTLFDSAALSARHDIRTVDLQRLEIGVQQQLDPAMIHGLRFNEHVMEHCLERLVWSLRGYVWAESPKEISVSYPADWWEHFKLRWFPKWAAKRWPVRYTTKRMEGQLFYPCLPQTVPEHQYRLRMAIYDGESGTTNNPTWDPGVDFSNMPFPRDAQDWRQRHKNADKLVAGGKSGKIIAAVYYEPSARDEADLQAFWRVLADEMPQQ